ncbi:QRFP-like peptide receptor [Actinia tenebrosa]|uniref:QRFP-like peptide receptor n=1 Tax=Actinia tenebrosa TaxID=6105 RepID=A0A6P8HX52_ACTTE|nr:QRFP-like peptide receptor [Actinia tenebrosa]
MLSLFVSPNISNNSYVGVLSNDISQLNRGLKITLCSVVGVAGLLGNLLVILAVCRVPRMKTTTFYLIVNMSVSDILFTFISMPPFILGIAGYGLLVGGTLGSFLCKFVNFSVFSLMASSVLTMTAIAFDRFFAITKPMKDIINMVVLQRVVIAIWLISFVTSSPLIYSFQLGQDNIGCFCYEEWSPIFDEETGSRIYTLFDFIVIYMVPFLTIAVLYSLIARHLWFGKSSSSNGRQTQINLLRSRRKVVIMLITVIFFFIICWLPLQILTLLAYFSEIQDNREVLFMGEFLIRTNAAINPLLYLIFSSTFRQAVKETFVRSHTTRNPTIEITSPEKGNSGRRMSVPISYFSKNSIYHHNDSFLNLKRETTL